MVLEVNIMKEKYEIYAAPQKDEKTTIEMTAEIAPEGDGWAFKGQLVEPTLYIGGDGRIRDVKTDKLAVWPKRAGQTLYVVFNVVTKPAPPQNESNPYRRNRESRSEV